MAAAATRLPTVTPGSASPWLRYLEGVYGYTRAGRSLPRAVDMRSLGVLALPARARDAELAGVPFDTACLGNRSLERCPCSRESGWLLPREDASDPGQNYGLWLDRWARGWVARSAASLPWPVQAPGRDEYAALRPTPTQGVESAWRVVRRYI